MAILFHRAGEQAKPLDFFRPRVRLSIVLVESKLGEQTDAIAFATSSFVGGLLSSTIGVLSLLTFGSISKDLLVPVWTTWLIGDTLGGLVVAPLFLQFGGALFDRWKNLIGILTLAVLSFIFVFLTPKGGPFLFLLFPVLLLAARERNKMCILVVSALICAGAIVATIGGFGPFSIGTVNERLIHLQFFLASYVLSGLVLSGLGREKLSRIPAIAVLFCWVFAGSIFYSFDQTEREKTTSHFDNLVADTQEKTLALIASYEDVLRGGVGLYSASKSVEYDEWKAYNKTLLISKHHRGLTGLGVIWPVQEKDLDQFQNSMRREGLKDFRLKSVPGVDPKKSSDFETHYIIKFIEPFEVNSPAVGLVVSTESNRKLAAEAARDSGKGVITSKIFLVQDQERKPGVLYFLPIYKKGAKLDSIENRRAAHMGWVYSAFTYQDFFQEVFSQSGDELELQVVEDGYAHPEDPVFSNFSDNFGKAKFDKSTYVQLGTKNFELRWAKSPKFVSSHNTIVAWVGFCGAVASLLLLYLISLVQIVGQRSQEIAAELTKELSASREKFRQGERRLLYALDGSNDGIWDWDIESGEMYVSGKIAQTHGWPQTFSAKSAKDLEPYAHPEDLKSISRSINNVLKGLSKVHEVETRYQTSSGEWRWVLTRGKISERNSNGAPKRMTGVHIDIHELKISQGLLEQTQYKLSSIANNVPTKVSLWTKDLKCEFANERFGNWFGKKPEDILGRYLDELVPKADLAARMPSIQKALAGELVQYEREAPRPADGELRNIIVNFHPYLIDGSIEGFFLFIKDVTDQKRAEIQAITERKAAVDAANVKSQFLANMSHEIRTPLNGIIGMNKLMRATDLNSKQRDYAETISRSSDALLNLINDILDFSKVEAGKLELEIVAFNLTDLIDDVLKIFSFSAQEKGLSLKRNIRLVSEGDFKGDPGRIRQILTNLIGNAIKFTAAGSVSVNVQEEVFDSKSNLKFEIIDTGIGIPRESISRMFQAFTQADATTTRRFGGTGLGLSISKQLVQLMGGEVGVESVSGKGSTFWFSLSLEHGAAVESSQFLSELECTKGARILIVEDNRVNQQIAIEILEQLGYKPHAVGNGFEALDALRESTYDVVLMDCQMPEMDGFQATEIIRRSDSLNLKAIPIIAMTANAMSGDREKCLAVGMNEYVTKPIDENSLIQKIEKCLSASKKTEELGGSSRQEHILVVEDNLVNQQVISHNLASLGYTFDIAENGLQALEFLSNKTCDLVLMDCQMPEMDGFEATRRIRSLQDKTKSQIPIVALTANALKGDRERCLESGMNDYLTKPIDTEDLAKTLNAWLRKESVDAEHGESNMQNEAKKSVIDMTAIEKLRKLQKPGRPSLVTNLIGLYFEAANENMVSIRNAVQANDLRALSAAAHALKSSSANLGAIHFSALCLELEKLGDGESQGEGVAKLVMQLEKEFVEVLKELEGLKVAA